MGSSPAEKEGEKPQRTASVNESHSHSSAVGRLQVHRQGLYSPFPMQLGLVWPLLYKFRDCTRLAEDKADTTNLSLALALVLVKPLEIGTSGKGFRDPTTVPVLSSPWISLDPLSGVSMKELEELEGTDLCQILLYPLPLLSEYFRKGSCLRQPEGQNSHSEHSVKLCSICLSQHNISYLLYC